MSLKPVLMSMILLSGCANAYTDTDDSLIKGNISFDEYVSMSKERFDMIDRNLDGKATATEKAEAIATVREAMRLVGRDVPEWMDDLDPTEASTKKQFMHTRKVFFGFLDKNRDDILSESERQAIKDM